MLWNDCHFAITKCGSGGREETTRMTQLYGPAVRRKRFSSTSTSFRGQPVKMCDCSRAVPAHQPLNGDPDFTDAGAHFRDESDVARSAGGNHFRACTMSKLNDEIADGSGGAVNKDTLATLQPAILEKHRPGRHGDDRHSAGFDEAKFHRLARQAGCIGSRKLGVCSDEAIVRDSKNRIAGLQIFLAVTDLDD